MDPFFHTGLSISDSLKTVRKSVLIYETIIPAIRSNASWATVPLVLSLCSFGIAFSASAKYRRAWA